MPLAVSADGRTVAVESYGDLFLYDPVARRRITKIPRRVEDDKVVPITSLTLTPDGQTLAYVGDREVVYYDRTSGQIEHTRPDDDKVHVFAVRVFARWQIPCDCFLHRFRQEDSDQRPKREDTRVSGAARAVRHVHEDPDFR